MSLLRDLCFQVFILARCRGCRPPFRVRKCWRCSTCRRGRDILSLPTRRSFRTIVGIIVPLFYLSWYEFTDHLVGGCTIAVMRCCCGEILKANFVDARNTHLADLYSELVWQQWSRLHHRIRPNNPSSFSYMIVVFNVAFAKTVKFADFLWTRWEIEVAYNGFRLDIP